MNCKMLVEVSGYGSISCEESMFYRVSLAAIMLSVKYLGDLYVLHFGIELFLILIYSSSESKDKLLFLS